jgi:hypothetical protein
VNKRIPALLASAAIGVIALTGCSSQSGAADIGGDPGNRSPMLAGVSAGAKAEATAGSADVTPLTEDEFPLQRQGGLTCRNEPVDYDDSAKGTMTYCEKFQVVGKAVQWTAYLAVPGGPGTVDVAVQGGDFSDAATLDISAPYVKIVWDAPSIPVETTLSTDMAFDLGTTPHRASNEASYEDFGYTEDQLAFE